MFRSFVLCLATTVYCLSTYAQAPNGTIQGRVVDQSSASIGDAKVTVVEVTTGTRQEILTSEGGRFVLPYLKPGEYTVTVEKVGFDKSVTNSVVLKNQQTIDLDLSLKIGQASTVVEVSATAAQLATSSSMVT